MKYLPKEQYQRGTKWPTDNNEYQAGVPSERVRITITAGVDCLLAIFIRYIQPFFRI